MCYLNLPEDQPQKPENYDIYIIMNILRENICLIN